MKGTPRRLVISLRRPAISSVSAAPSMTQGPAIRNNGLPIPTSYPASCIASVLPGVGARSGPGSLRKLRGACGTRGADEAGKERMPVPRGGGELGVELRGDEPRVIRQLDHFHQAVAR